LTVIAREKDTPFPEAMITLPGKSYPDSDLTVACAGSILAPPKTADLKQ
jgi:hypothetical protein